MRKLGLIDTFKNHFEGISALRKTPAQIRLKTKKLQPA